MSKKENKVFVQNNDEIIELKGIELDIYLEQRAKDQTEMELSKAKYETQKELKISAYKKLGLTDEEIQAII